MLQFVTAETGYRRELCPPGTPVAELCPRLHWLRRDVPPYLPKGLDGPPLYAHVNHGRWLVECDDQGCLDAQFASETDPRFFCVRCLNKAAGGQWRPVVWPGDPARVEQILLGRADVGHRTWYPSDGKGRPLGTPPAWGAGLLRQAAFLEAQECRRGGQ